MVFKAYDIRGVVDRELTRELAAQIGYAAARLLDGDVVLGMDVRVHSFSLAQAFAEGVLALRDVVFIGHVTTPVTHFASLRLNLPAAMVTASHNPPEYNGFKLMHRGGVDLESHEIQKLASMLERPPEARRGLVRVRDVLSQYFDYMATRFGQLGLSAGFDPANAAGVILKPLVGQLFRKAVSINDVPDGRFPSHPPDPEKAENLRQLQELVVKERLDVGIALDGDGDRVGMVAPSGRVFRPEKMAYALLEHMTKPGDVVVLDVTMPLYLERVAEERGVKVVRQRVGHSFQKATAVRYGAAFWAEYSGHLGFRDNHYFDDGLYAALAVLSALEEAGESLDRVLDRAPAVFEERFDVEARDPRGRVERVREVARAMGLEMQELDGIDVRSGDGRLLIRPSNTEPLVRVKVEAFTREQLDRLKSLASKLLSI